MLSFTVSNWTSKKNISKQIKKPFNLATKITNEKLQIKEKLLFDVILVNSTQMQKLNRQFRKINQPTDVLTFALRDAKDIPSNLLGEIYLCPEYIQSVCNKKQDSSQELTLAFIHGILHLLGYSHHQPKKTKAMMQLQDSILHKVYSC